MSDTGAVQLRQPKVTRGKLCEVVASLPPCTIGIEACTGAHHWARQFAQHGHTVKLMAPKLVAPYRMSGKLGKTDLLSRWAMALRERRGYRKAVVVPLDSETAAKNARMAWAVLRKGEWFKLPAWRSATCLPCNATARDVEVRQASGRLERNSFHNRLMARSVDESRVEPARGVTDEFWESMSQDRLD